MSKATENGVGPETEAGKRICRTNRRENGGSSRELVLPSETITFRETVKEQVSPLNNITKKNLLYPMVYQVEATSSDSMKREASFVHLFVRSSVRSFRSSGRPFFRFH